MLHRFATGTLLAAMILSASVALNPLVAAEPPGNKPERVEWLRDAGFGLFVHWSVDSQLGPTISHSLVGASDDYVTRFFRDLPRTFNPKQFDAETWARTIKVSGVKYVVFTAKHHSGFCMFKTDTTDFSIMHTPYGKDILGELIAALRKQEIAIGLYFSPDDFHFLHKQGKTISRDAKDVLPLENPPLMEHNKRQIKELFSNYGPIDVFFIDGPIIGRQDEGLKDYVWGLQQDVVITRGAMQTPEQYVPGTALDAAWESCITMGTQWQYKPTNDILKSGTQLIEMLIETRAKGGNLLLNIGPHPEGYIPLAQEDRLRELALWYFINHEAMEGVRPWILTNEENVWFTKKKDENTVYAIVTQPNWKWATEKSFVLKSVRATDKTKVSVLSQNDLVVEYRPQTSATTRWKQEADGLHITAVRAQRIYDDRKWPNAVTLRITHAEPAITPPQIVSHKGELLSKPGTAEISGELRNMGEAKSVDVSFQYRRYKDFTEILEQDDVWKATPPVPLKSTGKFKATIQGLQPEQAYEFRAVVKHPQITLYGQPVKFPAP